MRFLDWQLHFADFIAERRNTPFSWGANDCCSFAADWVKAATGEDLLGEYRDSYTDALTATRMLTELGGIEALVDQRLPAYNSPNFAQIGDILLCESQGRMLLAVCNGLTAFAPGELGLVLLPTLKAAKAWKV